MFILFSKSTTNLNDGDKVLVLISLSISSIKQDLDSNLTTQMDSNLSIISPFLVPNELYGYYSTYFILILFFLPFINFSNYYNIFCY